MINVTYLDVISEYYPDIEVFIIGADVSYSAIQWVDPTKIIDQSTLDLKILEMSRNLKISELSTACEQAIIGGFNSNALGLNYLYDAAEEDQINLIGACTTTTPTSAAPDGYSIYYACRNVSTGIKEYMLHTHSQLRQVMNDGATFKLQQLQKFHTKRVYVQSATLEQINNVTWDSIE